MIKKTFFPLIILCLIISCSKEKEPEIIKNSLPEILSLNADRTTIYSMESSLITCDAYDPDNDDIEYFWSANGGSFNKTNLSTVSWTAPEVLYEDEYRITVVINDSKSSETVTKYIVITVLPILPEVHTVSLYPTDDSSVSSGSPDTNFGGEGSLSTGTVDFGSTELSFYYSYLNFDISSLPANITIEKAELILITGYSVSSTKPICDVNLYHVSNTNWSESSLTYSNRPTPSSTVITILRDVKFNIVSEQRLEVKYHLMDYSGTNYSLMVHSYGVNGVTVNDYCYFYSKEVSNSYSPKLYIEYTLN